MSKHSTCEGLIDDRVGNNDERLVGDVGNDDSDSCYESVN